MEVNIKEALIKSTCADLRQKFLLAGKKAAGILTAFKVFRRRAAEIYGTKIRTGIYSAVPQAKNNLLLRLGAKNFLFIVDRGAIHPEISIGLETSKADKFNFDHFLSLRPCQS